MLKIISASYINNTELCGDGDETLQIPFNHALTLEDEAGNEYELIVSKDVFEAVTELLFQIKMNKPFTMGE